MEGFAYWRKPTGGMELVLVIGTRLGPDSIGAIKQLTPMLRTLLSEPSSVVIDEGEFERLGIKKVGDTAEILGKRVRVVGTVSGLRSLAGPYLFCSLDTARTISATAAGPVYIHSRQVPPQGRCAERRGRAARFIPESSRLHDRRLLKPQPNALADQDEGGHRAGAGGGARGLLVGAVVTSQTLYSATVASLKEYAVLRALGIPRWRMAMMVLSQSFWVGVAGVIVAFPRYLRHPISRRVVGAKVLLPSWLLIGACVITMSMAHAFGPVRPPQPAAH